MHQLRIPLRNAVAGLAEAQLQLAIDDSLAITASCQRTNGRQSQNPLYYGAISHPGHQTRNPDTSCQIRPGKPSVPNGAPPNV